jgi:hypothetical protein
MNNERKNQMKNFTLIAALLIVSTGASRAGWFDGEEKARRIEAEQQLQVERENCGNLKNITGILAVGCVALLTVGAAIGSKVRRDANKSRNEP